MRMLLILRTVTVLMIGWLGVPLQSAVAATVGECVDQSHDPSAVKKCRELIDDGTTSPAIYLRLSQGLNGLGERAESYRSIEQGLSRYPGDAALLEMQAIVRSNLTEQEYLDAQNRKGPSASATSNAKMRILRIKCMKKQDQEALDACAEYTALGGTDSDVQARQTSLMASLTPPPQPEPEPVAEVEPEPASEPRVIELTQPAPEPTPTPAPTDTATAQSSQQDNDNSQRIALVKDIQTRLNNLGFPAGTPDGLSGARTRRAISDFYATTDIGSQQPISQALLDDLIRAEQLQRDARSLYTQSQRALESGDVEQADRLFESARGTASWAASSAGLADQLASAKRRLRQAATDARDQQQRARRQQQIDELINSATAALDGGDPQRARRLLDEADNIDAQLASTAGLRSRVQQAIDTRERQQADKLAQQRQLESLLDQANRSLDQGELAQAQQAIAEARAINPEFRVSSALQARIDSQVKRAADIAQAQQILTRASTALAADQLDDAQQLANQARSLGRTGDADQLLNQISSRRNQLALEQQQARDIAQQNQQQATIATLVKDAQSDLQANNRAAASALANEILALDPDNPDALKILSDARQSPRQPASGQNQQRLAGLLEQGRILQDARVRKLSSEPDYFTDALPASIGQLFE